MAAPFGAVPEGHAGMDTRERAPWRSRYSRKPARCQPTTVLGVTKMRGLFHPDQKDEARGKEYEAGATATLAKEIMDGFARTAVPDADVSEVAKAIVDVVDMPFGRRPFRVHIDPERRKLEL